MWYQTVPLLLSVSWAAGAMAPTHLLVTRAGPCYGTGRTPVTVSELSLSTQIYNSLLSGEFNISEDIPNGWKVKLGRATTTSQFSSKVQKYQAFIIAMWYQLVPLLLYVSLAAGAMAPTHLLVTRAGPCYGTGRTPVTVSELSLSTQIYNSLLSGEFNISEDIPNGWKLKAEKYQAFITAMWYQTVPLLLSVSLAAGAMAPTHLLVTRAGPCYGTGRTPVTVSELSLSTQIYNSLLSGEFNISEDIPNGWKVKATMQKCVDIRNMDSCDFFRSFFVVKNGCSADDEEEQETYSNMLYHYAHPRLECPIKAGRYKLIDYPFFTEDNYLVVPESKISSSVFGYTFRLDGITKKRRQIFCVEALLQLMYTRHHNWVEDTHGGHSKETTVTTTSTPVTVSGEGEE
ncbi:hypothetical protein PYW07_002960 [Mythimna separata]|uniref:Uncharacterized protein n=1 Tax=Mythimna separata TaxID=271217 RepID=A0AAD7YG96_MYTSE|nr:hypothetical protein PYW07_002960 [Mythimna separata]